MNKWKVPYCNRLKRLLNSMRWQDEEDFSLCGAQNIKYTLMYMEQLLNTYHLRSPMDGVIEASPTCGNLGIFH